MNWKPYTPWTFRIVTFTAHKKHVIEQWQSDRQLRVIAPDEGCIFDDYDTAERAIHAYAARHDVTDFQIQMPLKVKWSDDINEWIQRNMPLAETEIEPGYKIPAALAGDTPETVTEVLDGAFRVRKVKHVGTFVIEQYVDEWTGVLSHLGSPLWPWRTWETQGEAERVILEYGRLNNQQVTVVRNDGAEIVTASPGCEFPIVEQDFAERCRAIVGWKSDGLAAAALRTIVRQLQRAGWTQDAIENGLKGKLPSLPMVGPEYTTGLAGDPTELRYRLDRVADMLDRMRSDSIVSKMPTLCDILDEATAMARGKTPVDMLVVRMSEPLASARGEVEQLAAAYAPPIVRKGLDGLLHPIDGLLHPIDDLTPPVLPADRLAETVKTGWRVTTLTPVSLPDEMSVPEHNGTFKIKPTIDGNAWHVWAYTHDAGWIRTIGAIENYPTYYDALDAIVEIAKLTLDKPTYVVTPSATDIERWNARGITIDPVTMTPAEAGAIVAEIAEEAAGIMGKLPPVTPVGTKLPVPIGDDLWRIDEWSQGEEWITVRDELTWEEVGAYLDPPSAAPPPTEAGSFEIVPSDDHPGMFNARQWTGSKWKIIAGNVTERTAKGVIEARKRDPENKITMDATKTPYKTIVKARKRLTVLRETLNADDQFDKALTLERIEEIIELLK